MEPNTIRRRRSKKQSPVVLWIAVAVAALMAAGVIYLQFTPSKKPAPAIETASGIEAPALPRGEDDDFSSPSAEAFDAGKFADPAAWKGRSAVQERNQATLDELQSGARFARPPSSGQRPGDSRSKLQTGGGDF